MNTDTPETDALAKAWQDWDSSSDDEMPQTYRELSRELERQRNAALKRLDSSERARKSLSEACDYLQAKQDATERLVRELRDALFGLTEECLLSEFSQDWDTYTEAQAALIKAKEVLK